MLSAPKLLSLLRCAAKCALEGEVNRFFFQIVEVMMRNKPAVAQGKLRHVASFSIKHRFCVLADKEVGFVILNVDDRIRRFAALLLRHFFRIIKCLFKCLR